MSDILLRLDECLKKLSYYNAAESDFNRETKERNFEKKQIMYLKDELKNMGLDADMILLKLINSTKYLVSKVDVGL